MPTAADYRGLLENWTRFARGYMFDPAGDGQTLCYGIGDSGHWSIQAHATALAALATLATDADTDLDACGLSRDELLDTSLRMLRFLLRSHKSGTQSCIDGQRWGNGWIAVLGIERAMSAIHALQRYMNSQDGDNLRTLIANEADWLLDHYQIVAGPVDNNKPESNIWNGCMLQRAASLLPDAPRAAAWADKAVRFFLNGISVPSDRENTQLVAGRPVRDWHVGNNFFESMALNHHGYMNLGYMIICLSNIAMLHFQFKQIGLTPPPALYHNAARLWQVVRPMLAPDGRLLRIGGDSRARYCYCQDYAIPVWLWAADYLGEDCSGVEEGWLNILRLETTSNSDGSFLGTRLAEMRDNSRLYYTRLEGDRAASVSLGALWRRLFTITGKPAAPVTNWQWEDEYHGAVAVRGEKRFASWVWHSSEKPQGLCLPPNRSDMAEWRCNLAGDIRADNAINDNRIIACQSASFPGGFITSGGFYTRAISPLAEGGEGEKRAAEGQIAVAALPDDCTMLIIQYALCSGGGLYNGVSGLHLLMPNDIFNRGLRKYSANDEVCESRALSGETRHIAANRFNIDGELSVYKAYNHPPRPVAGEPGAAGFTIHTPATRQIGLKIGDYRPHLGRLGGSLGADEIGLGRLPAPAMFRGGDVLIDAGFALCCEGAVRQEATIREINPANALWRGIEARGADGRDYVFIANLSAGALRVNIPGKSGALRCLTSGENLAPDEDGTHTLELAPGACRLLLRD